MKIRKIVSGLTACAVFAFAGHAANGTPGEDSGKSWWAHVQYLADDKLEGRDTGSPGFKLASDYLVNEFKQAGLEPAGTTGFLQEIKFHVVQIDETQSSWELERDGERNKIAIGPDATIAIHAENEESIDAEAVFVGYGFAVPERNFNELAGLDLRGKIAVAFAGSPSSIFGPIRQYYQSPSVRWAALRKAGAIGLVTIPNPKSAILRERTFSMQAPRPVWLLADQSINETPGLRLNATINPAKGEAFLEGSGHTLAELRALAESGQPLPKFPLAERFHVHVVLKNMSAVTSANVIGSLPGTDERLKKEYVVLIAHLDHLGVGRPVDGDSIYNGAMDNAAGVASLIEIAKSLGNGKKKPKRSILFLSTTGEEKGVLGSLYFVADPTVDRHNIVAAINMDMFLPLFPLRYLEVQGLGESTLGDDIRGAAQENGVEVQFDKQPPENRFVRGDHANFIKAGIPGVGFKSGWIPDSPDEKIFNEWIHTRYHKPSDDLNQPVDLAAAALFTRVVGQFALRVADRPDRPSWYPESFMSHAATRK